MNKQSPDELFTIGQAAQQLRKGRSTLYRLVRAGQVPYRVMPNGIRKMSRADIDATRSWLSRPVAVHNPELAA
jgi:excisionase family DNA binding protein